MCVYVHACVHACVCVFQTSFFFFLFYCSSRFVFLWACVGLYIYVFMHSFNLKKKNNVCMCTNPLGIWNILFIPFIQGASPPSSSPKNPDVENTQPLLIIIWTHLWQLSVCFVSVIVIRLCLFQCVFVCVCVLVFWMSWLSIKFACSLSFLLS